MKLPLFNLALTTFTWGIAYILMMITEELLFHNPLLTEFSRSGLPIADEALFMTPMLIAAVGAWAFVAVSNYLPRVPIIICLFLISVCLGWLLLFFHKHAYVDPFLFNFLVMLVSCGILIGSVFIHFVHRVMVQEEF